jgi:undecaprenyl-diphosphatase
VRAVADSLAALEHWDRAATLALNGWAGLPPPRAWILGWWTIGLLGTAFVALPLLWVAYRPGEDRRRLKRRLLLAVGAVLVPLAVVYALKPMVNRARPPASLPGVWVSEPLRARSFPSGHAAAAGAALVVAVALSRHRRAALVIAAPLALGVGYSRIALGAHFLFDVVVGLLIGVVGAAVCIGPLARRLKLGPPIQEAPS